MKYRNTLMVLATALIFGSATMASASPDNEAATKAEEAELQAKLQAEYEKALSAAEQQRLAAETAVEKAREQMQLATEQKKLSAMQSEEDRAHYEAKMSKMH